MNDYRGQPSVDDGQQHDDDTSPATPHLGMPPSHIFYVNPYSKISLYSFHVYMDTRNGPSRELVRFAGRFEASSRAVIGPGSRGEKAPGALFGAQR